jgi:hypothetical protein
MRPEALALGATTGPPNARNRERHRMGGNAQGELDSPAEARRDTGQGRALHHDGQWSRPEGRRQGAGRGGKRPSVFRGRQSVTWAIRGLKLRAALGGEDLRHGGIIAGVGAEAIDGLGREGDEAALAQHGRGVFNNVLPAGGSWPRAIAAGRRLGYTSAMTTLVYTHRSSLRHETPPGHPERVDRIKAVYSVLEARILPRALRREAPRATEAQLKLAHHGRACAAHFRHGAGERL